MNDLKPENSYCVSIPIAGAIHITVIASSADEAQKKAWDIIEIEGEKAGTLEWEFLQRITSGNQLHAPYNEVETTLIKR